MKAFRKLSIRGKLIVLLLLTSGSALLLSAFGFAVNDLQTFRQAIYDRLHAQADIIGANSIAALMFQDEDSARLTLGTLQSETSVIAAAVYDVEGRVFASFQRANVGSAIPLGLPERPAGSLGNDAYVVSPMLMGGDLVGHVFIRMELSEWKQRQVQHILIAAVVMGVSLLAVFILSSRLQRVVSEPIVRLAETARRVTEEKSYDLRAEKLSGDEIGDLVDDFNDMLDQIESRDQKLREHRELLEGEVQERTADLVSMTRQLEHQAFHDNLTNLANRALFDDHLVEAIKRAERDGSQLAVLFLDLDRFKVINDTLGHAVGDRLLVKVADRFKEKLRRSDTIARLGGDEFAVLLHDVRHPEYVAEVARKLIESIQEPFDAEGYNLHVTTSVGISLYPDDGLSAEVMLKNADAAMYRSKDLGRNRFKFFSADMNERALRRLSMENRLRRALREKEFEVWYQPRCDAVGRQILALEALVRWRDPQEGMVMPEDFISLAEDCGLIGPIDEWVLEHACRQLLALYPGAEPDITLSVNLSPSHFIREQFAERLERILQQTGFPTERLELEITESVMGPDYGETRKILGIFMARGIQVAIDDFGTGYSSLSRLKQLPIQTIKIDQTFVRDLGVDPDDEAITRTIISMAHSLNLKVVAEGVETEAQLRFVSEHGCDEVQGYLFGRPMPVEEIGHLLAAEDRRSLHLAN